MLESRSFSARIGFDHKEVTIVRALTRCVFLALLTVLLAANPALAQEKLKIGFITQPPERSLAGT